VRIASPVITSAPVLGTLAELADRDLDVAGVVDAPQTGTVFEQWSENARSGYKIPLLAAVLRELPFSGKPSIPWREDSDDPHNFMHAKVTVADDVVFLGSFNLSRSGERNAENMLEIHDPSLADRMAAFVDEIRALYDPVETPAQAAATISSGSSSSSKISRS
jgi:phosphatidylserine/phosphatidylglycerophosphate/cardiolipin synthase-like enzyme